MDGDLSMGGNLSIGLRSPQPPGGHLPAGYLVRVTVEELYRRLQEQEAVIADLQDQLQRANERISVVNFERQHLRSELHNLKRETGR